VLPISLLPISHSQNEMTFSDKYKDLLVQDVRKELHRASSLKVESIASKIRNMGFSCTQCGSCCRGCCTDNRVMLLQQDILTISENTHFSSSEFLLPFIPLEVEDALNGISESSSLIPYTDKDGNVHSFGWMLRRKKNGDCSFLESQISPINALFTNCDLPYAGRILSIWRNASFVPLSVRAWDYLYHMRIALYLPSRYLTGIYMNLKSAS